ncbi:MAG: hypothetical protein CMJ46_12310 [Planctomyces sp.]|nr:hypothetical protein [Planctomyces sp.]
MVLLVSQGTPVARGQEAGGKPATPQSQSAEALLPANPAKTPDNVGPSATKPDASNGNNPPNSLIDSNGNVLPLPADWQEIYLEGLKARQKNGAVGKKGMNGKVDELPAYNITSINVEGTVQEELADLVLTYKIQINSDEGAYKVPLGAKEGNLQDYESSGPGQDRPAEDDPDSGFYWWFKGKGSYELKLFMKVKIRVSSVSPQLFLSLPSDATIRNANLLLPQHDLEFPLAETTPLEQSELETGQTQVKFSITGEALNLTWKFIPLVKDKQVVLSSDTDIELTFQNDNLGNSVLIKARQTVQPDEQGSFNSFRLRLPPHSGSPRIQGEQYLNHETPDNNILRVILKKPATGPVTFLYELEIRPLDGNEFSLDGAFQVLSTTGAKDSEETSTQTLEQRGTITIKKGESFLIHDIPQEHSLIRNERVDSLNPEQSISQAFRFFHQPFRLKLRVDEIPPISTVDAHYVAELSPDVAEPNKLNVELKAKLNLNVMRGELRELNLAWENFAAEGWTAPSLDGDDQVDQYKWIEKVEYDEDSKQMRIVFLEPISSERDISFSVNKSVDIDETEIDLTLPQLGEEIRGRSRPPVISVISPPNLETEITPRGNTLIDRLSAEEEERYPLPTKAASQRPYPQRSITSRREQALRIGMTRQKRVVTAVTNLELRDLAQGTLSVRQKIELNVQYEALIQIRLNIPSALVGTDFVIRDEQFKPIKPDRSSSMGGASEQLSIAPSQGLGTLVRYIDFSVSGSRTAADGKGQQFQIPYFTVDSANFDNVKILENTQGQYSVSMESPNWQRFLEEDKNAWQLSTPSPESNLVALQLSPLEQFLEQDFQIPLALYRINLRFQSQTLVDARYLINGAPEQIRLLMPVNSQVTAAAWDEVEIPAKPSDSNREWLINIPEGSDAERHRLVIKYTQSDSAKRAGWSRSYMLDLPQFSQEIWTPQAVAEVTFPNAQHLLVPPQKWAPLFSWQREGIFWYRRPAVGLQENELYRELNDEQQIDHRYQYDFARTDSADSITFQSISLSMLVFYGSGTALLCGFLFRRLNFLQNSFAVCVVLFALAILGLWYWPVLQVFIQPALIGLLFAGIAVAIEESLKRRNTPEYSDSGSAQFVLTSSIKSSIRSRQIGSEDSTTLRPPSSHQVPVSTSENEEAP